MDKITVEPISDEELLERYFIKEQDLFFIELEQLAKLPFERLPNECIKIFQAVERWINTYLTQPHPELGRDGAVCPFVKACVVKKSFYLTAIYEDDLRPNALAETLESWKKLFLAIEPKTGRNSMYRTLLILFPEVTDDQADKLFKEVIELSKTSFVEQGLMLGEFHGGPPEKYGLHNKEFKPLYSPVPLLAIREMVNSDIAFLKGNDIHYKTYVKKFGEPKPKNASREAVNRAPY